MTSQQDQIQSLITDIERALSVQRSNKPWIRASDVEPQREALARAQDYLRSLQQTFEAPGGWGPVDPSTGQIAGVESGNALASLPTDSDQSSGQVGGQLGSQIIRQPETRQPEIRQPEIRQPEIRQPEIRQPETGDVSFGQFSGQPRRSEGTGDQSAESILQALLTEMKYLKSSALEPLRLEMDDLRQQRDRLQQEVSALDQQRTSLLPDGGNVDGTNASGTIDEEQLNDFLTALMGRLQENLTAQVGQTLEQLESDHAAAIAKLAAADEEVLQLRGSGQIEELRQLQGRSDQLLVNIDSTLQRMFETLQQNINSYQISLNEGIENMHSLGRQGEVIVRSLVDHLTDQLGQTTPPEPAFFPTRSAAVPLVLIDDRDRAFIETDADDESMDDTVTSLDEILPDLASDPVVEQISEISEPVGSEPVDSEPVDSELVDSTEDLQPEDCIREDGTIDLDLLKLDIDRADSEAIAPEDVMVDAAIADAQVAATESEDPEIEAKVTPTAESLYLADLTFDDLTVDPELSSDLLAEADSTYAVDSAQTDTTDNLDAASDDVNAAELAAVLPDLEDSVEARPTDDVQSANGPSDELRSEPLAPDEDGFDESAKELIESRVDSELVNLEVADSEAADTEVADSAVSEDDPGSPINRPESALVPDIPETDGELIDSIESSDSMNDVLSLDLAAELETVSREAEQAAAEAMEGDLDTLTSDLEEAVVFETEMPNPPQLSESADPLESALIPDQPETDALAVEADSLEASLDAVEASDQDEATGSTEAAVPALLPTDFDDDLDFYREDGLAEIEAGVTDVEVTGAETSEAESAASDPEYYPEPVSTKRVEATVEVASEESSLEADEADAALSAASVAGTTPLLEPPFSAPSAAPPVASSISTESVAADPIDPFATADLARDFARAAVPLSDEPPTEADDSISDEAQWFLGIDIGTTGISAVLINQLGEQVYPLCWNAAGDESNRFRLPAIAQIVGSDRVQPGFGDPIGEVGITALQAHSNRLLRHIKPLLKVGIPHGSSGEPWVQWSEQTALPLQAVQSALVELLKSLNASHASCRAVGLKDPLLRRILANLAGVVIGYPTNWPDTYSFNIREAVLAAGLVEESDRVFFVEEVIATLLSALPDPNMNPDDIDDQQPGLYNCEWSGGTVVLSAGATLTEAAIANLPEDLEQLAYGDFAMRSFGYAGDALDQDIICQLLHAPIQQPASDEDDLSETDSEREWRSLGLNSLSLPQPGEADRPKRYRLRQRLNASELGRQAIEIAQRVKVDLQAESQVEVSLGELTWTVSRKDLENKVFLPYIQRINRQMNALLNQSGLSTELVKQVVCTGGAASLSAIARWLRQKFPNATIIQDTYSGEYSNSCSRVAYGLANVCHYPNVLDGNRHQYSDYFLLLELLRILPDQPLPAGGILHLLEQRGINTQACQTHILALIEGHLPPGLVPIESDRPLISAQSPDIPAYESISELPLFKKQGGQIYIADAEQGERLRQHLENVLASKSQTLNEPQSLELAAETVAQR